MQGLKSKLPPLDPLVAFEAAARHSSFVLAAEELHVTPSAVSQQIRSLETRLGVSLFERGHRSVQLTAGGNRFYNSVTTALMHLVNASNDVRAAEGAISLEIAADTSVAALWLMPRLKRFETLRPDISLKLKVTDLEAELLGSPVQVALIHGDGDWRGYVSEPLFAEEVFPVCSPDYLARQGGTMELEELSRATLLDLDYERWQWMNWTIWLTEMGLPLPDSPRRLRTNNYPLMLEAARRGSGVALGWRHLVDDDLASGVLVKPVEDSIATHHGYHLVSPFSQDPEETLVVFRNWVLEERDRQQARGPG